MVLKLGFEINEIGSVVEILVIVFLRFLIILNILDLKIWIMNCFVVGIKWLRWKSLISRRDSSV